MTTPNDGKLATIRGLLAKAENGAATTAEAEAYMAKATELMAKYGVDRAMLAASDPSTDVIGDRVVTVPGPYAMGRVALLIQICDALGVRHVRKRGAGSNGAQVMHLFGYGSDLERVDMLFTSLLLQAAAQMTRDEREGMRWAWDSVKVWRRDWLEGFAVRIGERIADAERRARQQYDAQHVDGPSTALVLVDRSRLVEARFVEAYPNTRKSGGRRVGAGYGDGHRAGDRADIGASRIGGQSRALAR
jgi:Protein of unknown function (DUF2786)